MVKQSIVVLGATGRIGVQALKVIAEHPLEFKLVGISGYQNLSLLKKQITT